MHSGRRVADGPLVLQLLLAGLVAIGLWAALSRLALVYDPFVACQTAAATWVARLSTVGLVLPGGVAAILGASAALALGHQLFATRRALARVLAAGRPVPARVRRIAVRVGLEGRIDYVASPLAFTFCHGLLAPRVCVSAGLASALADDELTAVLAHEAHHARHHDPLKILISRTVAAGLSPLPAAGALHEGYLSGKEVTADAAAARVGGQLALARALVKLLAAERPRWPAGVLAIGAVSATEARVRRLVEAGTPRMGLGRPEDWIVTAALVAGLAGFSHGASIAAHAAPLTEACANAALDGDAGAGAERAVGPAVGRPGHPGDARLPATAERPMEPAIGTGCGPGAGLLLPTRSTGPSCPQGAGTGLLLPGAGGAAGDS